MKISCCEYFQSTLKLCIAKLKVDIHKVFILRIRPELLIRKILNSRTFLVLQYTQNVVPTRVIFTHLSEKMQIFAFLGP